MMRFVCFLLCVGLAFSCQRLDTIAGQYETATVNFEVIAATQQVITRSSIENKIDDLNIFLYGKNNKTVKQLFTRQGAPSLELPYDTYTVYVIANAGSDLGPLTEDILLSTRISGVVGENMPMSGETVIQVKKENGSVQIVPPVFVSRCVAKVDYNIRVSDEAKNLKLHSVQFVNIPKVTFPFNPKAIPSTNGDDFYSTAITDLSRDPVYANGRIYLTENLQGVNPEIKSEKDKNFLNAPKFATYMRIRAEDAGGVYDYMIYLGENTINDFNIRRNTALTLNITIHGADSFDWRIHSYMVEMNDEPCFIDQDEYIDLHKVIHIDCMSEVYAFKATVRVECADNEKVWLNGQKRNQIDFDIHPYNIYDFKVRTDFDHINPYNDKLSFIVTIADNLGYEFEYSEDYALHNFIVVSPYRDEYMTPNDLNNACFISHVDNGIPFFSTVDSREETIWHIKAGNSNSVTRITADVLPGYRFDGWWDSDLNSLTEKNCLELPGQQRRITQLYFYASAIPTSKIYVDLESVSVHSDDLVTIDPRAGFIEVYQNGLCEMKFTRDGIDFISWNNAANNKVLSKSRQFSYRATGDLKINLVYNNPVRLDIDGTANCYMFNTSQQWYCFNGTTKGNHKRVDGNNPIAHRPTNVKVLWSSGGSLSALIKSLGIHKSDVEFVVTGKNGNALLGVFDDKGQLLWSYHLWIGPNRTLAEDFDIYKGSTARWMNRYLGAMESAVGNRLYDRGLYYQWGRKDPLVYSQQSDVVYHPDYKPTVVQREIGGHIEYIIQHPTTFITNSSDEGKAPWLLTENNHLWSLSKTMYDPCPPGWRVPHFTQMQAIDFSQRPITRDAPYLNFMDDTGRSIVSYYAGGYLEPTAGTLVADRMGAVIRCSQYSETGAGVLSLQNGGAFKMHFPQAAATNIRCVKE